MGKRGAINGQPRFSSPSADVMPIAQLLSERGFRTPDAMVVARRALESNGLTNFRKVNIHVSKVQRAVELLRATFHLWCGSEICAVNDGRLQLLVTDADCWTCHGSRALRSLTKLEQCALEHDLRRILIVGGTPNQWVEIANGLSPRLSVNFVDGTRQISVNDARQKGARADIVFVWQCTPLKHSVSQMFASEPVCWKRIFVEKRGIEALTDALIHHVDRKTARTCLEVA